MLGIAPGLLLLPPQPTCEPIEASTIKNAHCVAVFLACVSCLAGALTGSKKAAANGELRPRGRPGREGPACAGASPNRFSRKGASVVLYSHDEQTV